MKFQWDAGNKPKIAAHNLTPEEVEEAMDNDALYQHLQWAEDEERELYYGEANSGRILTVVVTWRGQYVRVCTAYPLDASQKQDYIQQRTERSI